MNEKTFEATLEALVAAAFVRTPMPDARRRRLLAYTRAVTEALLIHSEAGLLSARELTLVMISGGLYVAKRAKRGIGKAGAPAADAAGVECSVGGEVAATGVRSTGAGVHDDEAVDE